MYIICTYADITTIRRFNTMKQFMDKDFLLSTDTAKALFHNYAENKLQRIVSLRISHRYGSEATTISGDRCVLTVLTNII